MASTNPARGMRDFLPSDVRKREYVIGIIKQVYESYGFEPLETPAVENIDTLMGKYGDEGNQLIFKILKRGEKLVESRESGVGGQESELADLALRYDLTVPLARVVANRRNDLPKFFKRYQIQPVWRADRPARGRFREFYQCDVDCVGSSSMVVEAELIAAVSEILDRLGFDDYVLRVNHRLVLTGILEFVGIVRNLHGGVLTTLDKLDKISVEQARQELHEKGVPLEAGGQCLEFVNSLVETRDAKLGEQTLDEANQEIAGKLQQRLPQTSDGRHGLDEIVSILSLCNETIDEPRVLLDPNLARGLSYYTGTLVEAVLTSGDFKGSIGGGGRYDGLIGMFGKEQIPACGFSLGLERILVVMEERGMFPPEIADSAPADVMVTIWNEETIAESLKLANELRSKGLRVTVYPEPDKLGKQIKYADSIKVPFVCVVGESEIAEGKVTLKNMRTGDQETLDTQLVAAQIKNISE